MRNRLISTLALAIFSLVFSQDSYGQFSRSPYGGSYDMSDMWLNPEKYKFCDISLVTGTIPPTVDVVYYTSNGRGKGFENKAHGGAKLKYYAGLAFLQAFNLAKFRENNSALHLSVGSQLSIAKYSVQSSNMKLKNSMQFAIDREYFNLIFPLGLDYKIGAEAAVDRYLKTMYTVGAGAALVASMDGGTEFGDIGVHPYLKVEAGYFLGIAMKLRLVYFMGEHTWYEGNFVSDEIEGVTDAANKYTVSSPGILQLGIVFMPWSRTWE